MRSKVLLQNLRSRQSRAAPTENAEVQRFVEGFKGKGMLTDDSQPMPAADSISHFKLAEGLRAELVAAEPQVMQPLSLSFDERGRMWVVQYRQYPFPAGLKIVRYDQYLRAVFDQVPPPPPNHIRGLDRVSVFEDLDRDGSYETSRDILTDLNIATSVAVGCGGLWVMNPPYLLFYPDANGDAILDGDPVVHLSGFGLEDTHAVANSLTWGPDGWLYGSNGSTTTGNVATRRGDRTRFEGQCVWRYQPQQEIFEIYAEGGGNTFSLEIDTAGLVFSGTNNGQTRGMYYPQGSYGIKNWGKHGPLTNPFAFGYFEHMRFEGTVIASPKPSPFTRPTFSQSSIMVESSPPTRFIIESGQADFFLTAVPFARSTSRLFSKPTIAGFVRRRQSRSRRSSLFGRLVR